MTIPTASLRALAQAATPGKWKSSRGDMDSYTADEQGEVTAVAYVYRDPEPRIGVFGGKFREDSRFISACSPSVILAILSRLDRQETLLAEAECVLSHMRRDLRPGEQGTLDKIRAALADEGDGA